jgi:hypothetical protein
MSEQATLDWISMKHALVRFVLGFAMWTGVAVLTGMFTERLFEPGAALYGWYRPWAMAWPLGLLPALTLFNSRTRRWRDIAAAAGMGLVAFVQMLAGIGAAILVMDQWFPFARDGMLHQMIPILIGLALAAPTVFGTVVVIGRKNRPRTEGDAA